MKKQTQQAILAGEVLKRLGENDEWVEQAIQESKPSRFENRRVKEQQVQQKRKQKHKFQDWND